MFEDIAIKDKIKLIKYDKVIFYTIRHMNYIFYKKLYTFNCIKYYKEKFSYT